LTTARDHRGAVYYLERAVESGHATAANYNNLGYCYRQTGRPFDAITAHRRALSLQPDLAASHHNLILTYLRIALMERNERSNKQRVGIRLPPQWLDDVARATSFTVDSALLVSAAGVYAIASDLYPEQGFAGLAVQRLEEAAGLRADPLPLERYMFEPISNHPRFLALRQTPLKGQGHTARQLLLDPD
jgi:tetratricopeptide (TPR) repeat protein